MSSSEISPSQHKSYHSLDVESQGAHRSPSENALDNAYLASSIFFISACALPLIRIALPEVTAGALAMPVSYGVYKLLSPKQSRENEGPPQISSSYKPLTGAAMTTGCLGYLFIKSSWVPVKELREFAGLDSVFNFTVFATASLVALGLFSACIATTIESDLKKGRFSYMR